MGLSRRLFLGGGVSLAAAMASGTTLRRCSVRAQASAWEVVDLFALTETISFRGTEYRGSFLDMNAAGEVGGSFVVSDVKFSPTIWSPEGKATRLKSGKYGGEVWALNNNGLAAGLGFLGVRGFESEESPYPGYTTPRAWKDGQPIEMEILGNDVKTSTGIVQDVNDDGIMVGYLLDPALNVQVPVKWQDGAVTVLAGGSPGGGYANQINNHGDIAGYARIDGTYTAAIWRGDEMELVTPPDDPDLGENSVLAISDLGEEGRILAYFNVPYEIDESTIGYSNASYVLDKDKWTKLTSPDETRKSVMSRSMNASGVIVGSIDSVEEDVQALSVIWEDGEGRILDEEFELPSGLKMSGVIKINDEGQILARATDADGVPHAIVLRPA
jgi:uncharacterized membrane protein